MPRLVSALLLITGAMMLSGCYQGIGVTLHEPGVYKGKHDPLLAKLKSQDWQNKLMERFKTGQSDR